MGADDSRALVPCAKPMGPGHIAPSAWLDHVPRRCRTRKVEQLKGVGCDIGPTVVLRAVGDRSLGDQVFDQLAMEIMSERYAAGAALPPERTLAEVFRVNRHVVREALKRLEQLGLVTTSRAGRTEVADVKRTAGLEVLAM